MRATARRENGSLRHEVEVGRHRLTADEPKKNGGTDAGPNPQELLAASSSWGFGPSSPPP